jgi:hypothetical protein
MCTVSWLREPAGYQVFFNRDERPTRAPGLPPQVGDLNGVRWLAPRDGDQLGTWIGANELGVTLGLLNRFEESPARSTGGGFRSRGLLVTSLLDLGDLDGLERRLHESDLSIYQPFTLTSFAPGEAARLFAWNGSRLSRQDRAHSALVLTSSGYDQAEATRIRGALFEDAQAEGGSAAEAFEALHRSHFPERGPFSICMHREEAATVSFTRVAVRPGSVEMTYVPGPPGETPESTVARLDRQAPYSQ